MAKHLFSKRRSLEAGAVSELQGIARFKSALIEHAAHIGDDMMAAITATGSVSGELLGDPSEELRANLADGPVRLFTSFQSM
jgi:hypothetical protein